MTMSIYVNVKRSSRLHLQPTTHLMEIPERMPSLVPVEWLRYCRACVNAGPAANQVGDGGVVRDLIFRGSCIFSMVMWELLARAAKAPAKKKKKKGDKAGDKTYKCKTYIWTFDDEMASSYHLTTSVDRYLHDLLEIVYKSLCKTHDKNANKAGKHIASDIHHTHQI